MTPIIIHRSTCQVPKTYLSVVKCVLVRTLWTPWDPTYLVKVKYIQSIPPAVYIWCRNFLPPKNDIYVIRVTKSSESMYYIYLRCMHSMISPCLNQLKHMWQSKTKKNHRKSPTNLILSQANNFKRFLLSNQQEAKDENKLRTYVREMDNFYTSYV